MNEIAIQMTGVTKRYRLGQIGHGTLQEDLQSWWAKVRGKEDPNRPVQTRQLEGDNFLALQNVDLTVYRGEALGIIGGNGAGKSTLLKLLSRVTAPSEGTIDIYGRICSLLEVGTGFNHQMTGRENIYMNGAILGMTRAEIDRALEDIIAFSEVEEFIDTPVKRYSSGMYVKLAFSVASHLDSEIVIMDEVLAVGDLAFQKKCIEKMRDAALREGRTILYVSHNMNTVRELCSRCVVLDQGRILYDGDTEDAIRFYSEYLMNLRGVGELASGSRRDRNVTGLCRIEEVRPEEDILPCGGEVRFALRINSRENLAGVRLRLIVSDEAGIIVGMSYSAPLAVSRGRNEWTCRFPAAPLAPGGYVCDMALFAFERDVQTRHDFVRKVLAFRLEEKGRLFGQQWTARNWGNVSLSPIFAQRGEERMEHDG